MADGAPTTRACGRTMARCHARLPAARDSGSQPHRPSAPWRPRRSPRDRLQRRALQLQGAAEASRGQRDAFRSTGDSEVVLHALTTWGPDALGMFQRHVRLGASTTRSRDSCSWRRHHAASSRSTISLGQKASPSPASTIRSSRTRGAVISQCRTRRWAVPAPRLHSCAYAVLQDTHMVGAGTWLLIRADGRKSHGRFFMFPPDEHRSLRGEEAVEAVDAAVTAAVRRQLVSDVPVGRFFPEASTRRWSLQDARRRRRHGCARLRSEPETTRATSRRMRLPTPGSSARRAHVGARDPWRCSGDAGARHRRVRGPSGTTRCSPPCLRLAARQPGVQGDALGRRRRRALLGLRGTCRPDAARRGRFWQPGRGSGSSAGRCEEGCARPVARPSEIGIDRECTRAHTHLPQHWLARIFPVSAGSGRPATTRSTTPAGHPTRRHGGSAGTSS